MYIPWIEKKVASVDFRLRLKRKPGYLHQYHQSRNLDQWWQGWQGDKVCKQRPFILVEKLLKNTNKQPSQTKTIEHVLKCFKRNQSTSTSKLRHFSGNVQQLCWVPEADHWITPRDSRVAQAKHRITKGIDMTPMEFTNINHWFPFMMPAKKNTFISWGLAERYGLGTVAMSPFRRDLPRHSARVSTKSGSFEGRVAGGSVEHGMERRHEMGWDGWVFYFYNGSSVDSWCFFERFLCDDQ